MTALQRSSFSTRDPGAARPALEAIYPNVRLGAQDPNTFRFDIDSVAAGLISTVRYKMVSPNSTGSIDTTGTLTVAHTLGGSVRMEQGRSILDTGRPWLFPQGPSTGFWDDVHIGAVTLDFPAVERFAHQLAGSDAFPLEFTGANPVTGGLSTLWNSTLRTLNRDLLRDDAAMSSPLVRRGAFDQMALALLSVFPNTVWDLREPAGITKAVPASLRRAKTYIDENLASPIALPDIAATAGLSIRGLTAAFRREFDTTPMGYVRAGRLAAAHRDLLAADPGSGVTVTSIAHRWGFGNSARFAAAHREIYGVAPAATFRS